MLKLKRRTDSAVAGLLLSYLFWGSLLIQCGYVDSNPGAYPPPSGDSKRQTRLGSTDVSGGRTSRERPFNVYGGASNQPAKDLTLSDVVAMIHSLKTSMDTKLHELKQEMQIMREDDVAMQEEVKRLRDDVSSLRQQNDDLRKANSDLSEKLDDLDRKTDDLEGTLHALTCQ